MRQYTNVLYKYHAYSNFGTFIIIPLKKETIYICFLYSVFVHVYCGNIGGGQCDLGISFFKNHVPFIFFNNKRTSMLAHRNIENFKYLVGQLKKTKMTDHAIEYGIFFLIGYCFCLHMTFWVELKSHIVHDYYIYGGNVVCLCMLNHDNKNIRRSSTIWIAIQEEMFYVFSKLRHGNKYMCHTMI